MKRGFLKVPIESLHRGAITFLEAFCCFLSFGNLEIATEALTRPIDKAWREEGD
jgi:hypothetical protein